MTDYLEPVTEAGSDALWEAERRLSAALAALDEQRQEPEQTAEAAGMEELLRESGQTALIGGEMAAPTAEETPTGGLEASARLPLSAAVEAMERVTERGLNSGAEQIEGPYERYRDARRPFEDGTPGQGRVVAFPETGRPADVGEATQAERLDQLFRRDSRRYDGGFFLY